mmetsp:Transcript_27590/g.68588  ORF Transcript_27590/g.68588 Transcript_27590/m.68588 type:complete len:208 (+) Transcript_27590:203-826(+)|eukprot:CAMPEP_0182821542 /NCGR_PEP_ID=MMETSP0006_2-20121128/13722_1 /TAXON_ID=97485 /ORGANISM="Prymnesium parvum, Strain Texoma1" /LENGTH=207 /DNA_ID=CAMNT_0024948299 /DNA_START=176 /DNA_END=799 /DNA_ORIENTATION=-
MYEWRISIHHPRDEGSLEAGSQRALIAPFRHDWKLDDRQALSAVAPPSHVQERGAALPSLPQSVVLHRLAHRHDRLAHRHISASHPLDRRAGLVQLCLNVNQAAQHEEHEQREASDVRVALVAEQVHLQLAGRRLLDGREEPQVVQRVEEGVHDEVEVESVERHDGDERVPHASHVPELRDPLCHGAAHGIARHWHDEKGDEEALEE